jgi:hypothetical protein
MLTTALAARCGVVHNVVERESPQRNLGESVSALKAIRALAEVGREGRKEGRRKGGREGGREGGRGRGREHRGSRRFTPFQGRDKDLGGADTSPTQESELEIVLSQVSWRFPIFFAPPDPPFDSTRPSPPPPEAGAAQAGPSQRARPPVPPWLAP